MVEHGEETIERLLGEAYKEMYETAWAEAWETAGEEVGQLLRNLYKAAYNEAKNAHKEPPKFSFENFYKGEFAVYCDSAEDARLFITYLRGKGISWSHGAPWVTTLTKVCYYIDPKNSNHLCYCNRGCCERPITPFCWSDLD